MMLYQKTTTRWHHSKSPSSDFQLPLFFVRLLRTNSVQCSWENWSLRWKYSSSILSNTHCEAFSLIPPSYWSFVFSPSYLKFYTTMPVSQAQLASVHVLEVYTHCRLAVPIPPRQCVNTAAHVLCMSWCGCMCESVCVWVYVCVSVWVNVRTYVCVSVCVRVSVGVCMCVWVWVSVCVWVCVKYQVMLIGFWCKVLFHTLHKHNDVWKHSNSILRNKRGRLKSNCKTDEKIQHSQKVKVQHKWKGQRSVES